MHFIPGTSDRPWTHYIPWRHSRLYWENQRCSWLANTNYSHRNKVFHGYHFLLQTVYGLFSNVAYPLTRITQKDKKFEWSKDCEKAFNSLKHLLPTTPILSSPSTNDMFILDTDASAYGVGAVLSQLQDGKKVIIAYGSKTLSRSQMGYCTTYRELLAVVTFVKQFRHYLYGQLFLLRTDHASLIWLKNFKEPEGLLVRYISLLETYYFTIEHRRRSHHGNTDGLSRRPRKRCKRENCRQCSDGTECSVMLW